MESGQLKEISRLKREVKVQRAAIFLITAIFLLTMTISWKPWVLMYNHDDSYNISSVVQLFPDQLVKDIRFTTVNGTIALRNEDVLGLYIKPSRSVFTRVDNASVLEITFITAHEIGHDYWFNNLTRAERNLYCASLSERGRYGRECSEAYADEFATRFIREVVKEYYD